MLWAIFIIRTGIEIDVVSESHARPELFERVLQVYPVVSI